MAAYTLSKFNVYPALPVTTSMQDNSFNRQFYPNGYSDGTRWIATTYTFPEVRELVGTFTISTGGSNRNIAAVQADLASWDAFYSSNGASISPRQLQTNPFFQPGSSVVSGPYGTGRAALLAELAAIQQASANATALDAENNLRNTQNFPPTLTAFTFGNQLATTRDFVNNLNSRAGDFAEAAISTSVLASDLAKIGFDNSMYDWAPDALEAIDSEIVATTDAPPNITTNIPLSDIPLDPPTPDVTQSITVQDLGNIPELVLADPILALPDAPDTALPISPGEAPTFNAPNVPDAPSVTLPPLPTFEPVIIPEIPTIALPDFVEFGPVDDLIGETTKFDFVEQEYDSELLRQLSEKLGGDLLNGGYGIEASDELPLWERARERELRAINNSINELSRTMASRGFALPPGAYYEGVRAAQRDGLEKITSLSRDIALKRADMYVEARKFAIEKGIALEQMQITYASYIAERALNAARAMAELSITDLQAKIAAHNLKVEKFRARVQAYQTRLQAAMSHLESYKTQVEGARLTAEVQKLNADVYSAQLEGVKTLVDVYRTEVEAANIAATIERTKLEAYRSAVEAYTAQVGAKTAEFGMYESALKGEMTKVDLYKTRVEAYGSRVDAYRAKAQAISANVEAQATGERLKLERFEALLKSHVAKVDSYSKSIELSLATASANVERYKAVGSVNATQNNTALELAKANADIAAKNVANTREATKDRLARLMARSSTWTDTSERMVKLTSALAGSMSSITAAVES